MKELLSKYLAAVDVVFANNYFNDCKDLSNCIGFDYEKVTGFVKSSVEECLNDDKEFQCI